MSQKRRRTKIIATLGPASNSANMLEALIKAGVDIVRINFSHGDPATHQQTIAIVREAAKAVDREIGVLADLQGPKIRIARFKQRAIQLHAGDEFILDANLATDAGDQSQVGIDYKALPADVGTGDVLLLDDGRIELDVLNSDGTRIITRVRVGGELSNNKGINRLGGGLSAEALTEKDKQDLITAVGMGADFVAISFPRSAQDILQARALLQKENSVASVIAKIERKEAVDAIDEIINASDGVMVARGDLGVELGYAAVPGVQKYIIRRTRELNKAVITATQMMESMVHNMIPTRAEVSDVANAVLDGTDAVMLSAETATGAHPAKVVASMADICIAAEQNPKAIRSRHRVAIQFERVDEAIAMATMYTANHLNISAIICLTESGSTPLLMSRIRSGIPIYALSRHETTRHRMTLYRGVYPLHFDATQHDVRDIKRLAVEELVKRGVVTKGERVILTKGDVVGVGGRSNAMKIITVGDPL
ncbi:MAG: pyruvate kinase [Gammaproteobacteria bacterium]